MKASVFCGQSGYPYLQTATIHRIDAFCDSISREETVFVLNRHPLVSSENKESKNARVLAGFIGKQRHSNFFVRNALKAFAPLSEFFQLLKLKLKCPELTIHIYTEHTALLVFYALISKLLNAQAVHHYVELRSAIPSIGLIRINHFIYDAIAPKIVKRHLAISQSIENHISKKKLFGSKMVSIVPPICSFSKLSRIEAGSNCVKPYFLFCGSSDYFDTAKIVVDSFRATQDRHQLDLILIISGKHRKRICDYCTEDKRISIQYNLPYADLIGLYKSAHALLIPLRRTLQDEARYPQKICEYLASQRPIITTQVGDVSRDFENGVTAFIANDCSIASFSNEILKSITHPELANQIGKQGFDLGIKRFNSDVNFSKLAEYHDV